MKKVIVIFIMLFPVLTSIHAQGSMDSVLTAIENNNSTLNALRKQIEAQKTGNKTGLLPQNPDVEFNYLWGNPSPIGNRTDIRITQTFDFPTAYGFRNQISDARNDQLELSYKKELKSILLEARLLCIGLLYTDNLKREYENRVRHAGMIASSFLSKYENGETGIMEHNKARLNLLNLKKEAERIDIDRNTILDGLKTLNGGVPIEFNDLFLIPVEVPEDFGRWYEVAEKANPVLSWFRKEAEIGMLNEKLVSALGLPKITTGYMSEKVVGEHFQGVTAGISIPLWGNRNQLKYARANSAAIQSAEADSKLIFYNQLKTRHKRAVDLQKLVQDYRLSVKTFDNTIFLEKALNAGEIDLTDYLTGISVTYESMDKLLAAEKELHTSIALLNQY